MPTSCTSSTPRSANTTRPGDGQLPRSAVDQGDVRPFGLEDRLLPSQGERSGALVPPSSWRNRRPGVSSVDLMLNLRYSPFSKPSWPRDDHSARRGRALNVRVVVHLNAARRGFKDRTPPLTPSGEQLALRAALSVMRQPNLLACVLHRHLDDIALLAALRTADLDLVVAHHRGELRRANRLSRIASEIRINLRRWALIVELADERLDHLAIRQLTRMAREIEVYCPDFWPARKKNCLDADLAAFQTSRREQIGFHKGGGIDALQIEPGSGSQRAHDRADARRARSKSSAAMPCSCPRQCSALHRAALAVEEQL